MHEGKELARRAFRKGLYARGGKPKYERLKQREWQHEKKIVSLALSRKAYPPPPE